MLHCGGKSCDWDMLVKIVHTSAALIGTHALGLERTRLMNVVSLARPLRGWDRSLWKLLEMTIYYEVSDPRDKVFALLGLADDRDDFLHLIDYEKDPYTLYLEVFQHYLDAGRPGILNRAGNAAWRRTRTLPSWTADWLVSESQLSIFEQGSRHEQFLLTGISPSISADGKSLSIRGFILDQVASIRSSNRGDYKSAARTYLDLWRRLATESSAYPTGVPSIDAFAQTLVLGAPQPTSPFKSNDDLLTTLHAWLKERSLVQDHAEWTATDIFLYDFYRAMNGACFNRTFFKTHSGFIGLGSYFLRPGDLIVELHNGTTPFAIRPAANECYTLVGDAYMHGIMEGPVEIAGRKILEFSLV
jgi:hypothetical protein